MSQLLAKVLGNEFLAEDHFRIRILAPEIARTVLPGQFVMLRKPDELEPFLPRAYSIHNISSSGSKNAPDNIEILYKVVGKMTRLLAAAKPGESLSVWGPLGRPFTTKGIKKAALVAGGIGIAPFLFLARTLQKEDAETLHLFFGACAKEHLVGLGEFEELGVEVHPATEDGSCGYKGFITEIFGQKLTEAGEKEWQIYGCGPHPMLARLAEICKTQKFPCEVSLEAKMACGIGACRGCAQAVLDESDAGFHYELACKDGPVFDAARILWSSETRNSSPE
jgi:dihydroorotate dehydrogenase electron transfer subunit